MDQELIRLTLSLAGIDAAARQLWAAAGNHRVWAFSGTLGAGKTTLIHALCDYLGVTDTVSSPTFALINEYHYPDGAGDRTIYHMDWYRLRDVSEAVDAGMEDSLLQEGALCLVEWPERARELLRSPYVWITLETVGESERLLVAEVR